MIIVRLMGGLGNQMFQYAFGRGLAIRNSTSLFLDTSFLVERENVQHTIRDLELKVFEVPVTIASKKEVANFRSLIFGLKAKIYSRLPYFFNKHFLLEKHFQFDPKAFAANGSVYAEGYWQSQKYFEGFESTIRNDFEFNSIPSVENSEVLTKIKAGVSVSMHVRRGDMVSLPAAASFHGTCTKEYYMSALKSMKSKFNNFHLFVFSDDPDYVRSSFKFDMPFTIVDHNSGASSFEDMRLMSNCSHHIIANSSFSWWGAWLNPDPDKTVIAPKQWFASTEINTSDLIPDTWIRM